MPILTTLLLHALWLQVTSPRQDAVLISGIFGFIFGFQEDFKDFEMCWPTVLGSAVPTSDIYIWLLNVPVQAHNSVCLLLLLNSWGLLRMIPTVKFWAKKLKNEPEC